MVKGDHFVFYDPIKRLFSKRWKNMKTKEAFVSFPSAFISLYEGQITFCNELVEGRYGLQNLPLQHRILPGANSHQNDLRLLSSLVGRQNCRRPNFQLFLLAMSIAISDIESLPPRRSNLKHESLQLDIKIVNSHFAFGANATTNKFCAYICVWHFTPVLHFTSEELDI
jgi:hypothetical protein